MGAEAKTLFDEATKMLNDIISKKMLRATGIVGFYPANAVDDDIQVYADEERDEVIATFYGLRQQAQKDVESNEPYYCLSDFIATKKSRVTDYIGAFAVSVGFG